MKSAKAALRRHLDHLVHGSASADPLEAWRHRIFIAGALVMGALALALFPLYIVRHGPPDMLAAATFAFLASPLALAVIVSHGGNLRLGALLNSLLATLLLFGLGLAGALAWPAVIAGLGMVLVEAALFGAMPGLLAALAMTLAASSALVVLAPAASSAGGEFLAFVLFAYGGAIALKLAALLASIVGAHGEMAARYRFLSDHGGELVSRHHEDGGVGFASPSARAILSARPAELLGEGLFERVHIADRPAYLMALAEARQGRPGKIRLRLRTHSNGGNGNYILANMRALLWRDPLSREEFLVSHIREAGKEAEQEAALHEARMLADQATRARDGFLSHMSHQLRTPLNVIIGFSGMLADETLERAAGESRRDYAKLIHAAGEQLLHQVNELLDLARLEAAGTELVFERIDPRALLEATIEALRGPSSAKGLSILANLARDIGEVEADPAAYRRICQTLLDNAIRFSPVGGKLVLDLRREASELCLTIRDFGIGMEAEEARRLSQGFLRRDGGYDGAPGSGLSLALVARLAQLHGGRFSLQGAPGQGMLATLNLPMACGQMLGLNRIVAAPVAKAEPDWAEGEGTERMREKKIA